MRIIIQAIIIALATAFALPQQVKAQSDWQTGMDSMMIYVNKTPITTGMLIDRSMPISNMADFLNARDTSSYAYAIQVYSELYGSSFTPQRMTKPELLFDMIAVQNIQNRLPIQVLDYKYNQIKPTAIQDGLLAFDNNTGLLYNTTGNPNPFIEKRLQLATLLAEKIETTTVTLALMPHFISRNTGLNVTQIKVGGAGINKLLTGPVDTATVSFPAFGKYNLTITVTLSDGSSFSTINTITIGEEPGNELARIEPPPPCYNMSFEGSIPWQGYDEQRAYRGKFDISIYYRTGISCASGAPQSIKKPVILIDGFDPTDKRNSKNRVLYSKFLKFVDDVNFNPGKEEDFVEKMRDMGFDVIIVDIPTYWYDNTGNIIPLDSNANRPPPGYSWDMGKLIRGGGDYVERNSMTMVSLLQYIQQQLNASGSNDSIVLIGPSMGGQITRYALKYMEDRGMSHKVRLWISQDSNHEGAVLPIGEQFIIAYNAREKNAASIIARDRQLFAPATRQFLVTHFIRHIGNLADLDIVTEQAGGAPNFFDRYYRTIDSIGWPQQCRKIATISGGENGAGLNMPGAFSPAMKFEVKLGNKNYFYSALCDMFSNTNCRMATFNMFTSPASGQRGLVAKARLPMLSRKDREFYIIAGNQTRSQSVEAVQSGYYWGYEELASQLDKTYAPFIRWTNNGSEIASIGHHITITKTLYTGKHTHQPTGSTLAYGKGSNPNAYSGYQPKWDDDVTPYNLSCDKYIPFDAYMGPKTFSVLHDSIFYSQAQVLISEIQGIIPNYPKPNKTVFLRKTDAAKYYFCPGETLTFFLETNYGDPNTLTPFWTVNTDKLQIVAGQGTTTVSVKYLGGLSYDEFQALGGLKISVSDESPCYRLQPAEAIGMGAGDIWGGNVTSVASGQGFQLQFGNGYNMSDRANVKIIAGLAYKENNLQNYTLMQNTYSTTMTWNTTPISFRGRQENQLNISSNVMGEYIYKVKDANRCQSFTNSFKINFSRQLQFRILPNPAKDEVTIEKILPENGVEYNKPAKVTITINDFFSQQPVMERQFVNGGNLFMLPVNNLKDGTYAVRIQYGEDVYTEKLIIKN